MSRLILSLFVVAVLVVASAGSPPDDPKFNNIVAVQAAMKNARTFLTEGNSAKAVDVLEEQLAKVNGNPQYLVLLRDAYRAYIRDLYIANRPDQAKRYLDRLCILEPGAANDPALKPAVDAAPRQFESEPAPPKKIALPTWKLPNPFAKKEDPKPEPQPKATIRLLGDGAAAEDPFDRKNERATPTALSKAAPAQALLARGADEFKLRHYAEARQCFEQAYRADPASLDVCREQWAYCILAKVVDAMEQPGALPAQAPMLQREVDAAIQMAPTKMMAQGQKLLAELESRAKALAFGGTTVKVRHMGANKEGWQVTKTAYFLIFHKQDNDFAERVAKIAEATRAVMYKKWFMSEGIEWEPACELILHPTAGEYTHMTGVPSSSPGHSRIECDNMGRVISRRMDLRQDNAGMMEAVLPHETTHVVLAGMFGAAHVPRWADEGIAVLSEPNEKIDLHRRNLTKHHREGQLFGLRELMELKDYPQPARVGAFYAQSVVLVEFLTKQRGPKVFTDFVKDGIRQGYEKSLQRHYNMTFSQLDMLWQKQVIAK